MLGVDADDRVAPATAVGADGVAGTKYAEAAGPVEEVAVARPRIVVAVDAVDLVLNE